MEKIFSRLSAHKIRILIASALLVMLSFIWVGHVSANSHDPARNGRLVTIYDKSAKKVILTKANTVKDALKVAKIDVTNQDSVEPALDTKLVATDYAVNVYRARPVVVDDGNARQKIITAAQTAEAIVADSNLDPMNDEDRATFSVSSDIVNDGASTILKIERAVPFTLELYGKTLQTSTLAKTVGEMIHSKGIKLTLADTVSTDMDTPIAAGMTVTILREGVQTPTVEEAIPFTTRQVLDFDNPVGFKKVQKAGVNGMREITYELTAHAGKEVSRKVIQSVVVKQPKEQIELVGAAPTAQALSRGKGAQYWTDSKGVSHRETYYNLNMNVVIGACGPGNSVNIRADGAKVDKDGYILVAAHLGNYPRCSVVETSMGLGKVYDTGGFAKNHPYGFDLATNW